MYLVLDKIAGGTTDDAVIAPWWSLALIPIGTRIRPADALRYE